MAPSFPASPAPPPLAGAPERSECNARLANSGKLTFLPEVEKSGLDIYHDFSPFWPFLFCPIFTSLVEQTVEEELKTPGWGDSHLICNVIYISIWIF